MFTTALWPAVDHFGTQLRHHSLQEQFPRLNRQANAIGVDLFGTFAGFFSEAYLLRTIKT